MRRLIFGLVGFAALLIMAGMFSAFQTHVLSNATQDIQRRQLQTFADIQHRNDVQRRVLIQRQQAAMALAPDEQCIGGTVVQVHGHDYEQEPGPVRCAGRSRLP